MSINAIFWNSPQRNFSLFLTNTLLLLNCRKGYTFQKSYAQNSKASIQTTFALISIHAPVKISNWLLNLKRKKWSKSCIIYSKKFNQNSPHGKVISLKMFCPYSIPVFTHSSSLFGSCLNIFLILMNFLLLNKAKA